MKLNLNTLKLVFAAVMIVATLFWAIDSVRPRAYAGSNLTVEVGSGPVSVTNTSDDPVLVQLVSPGTRTFVVSSTTDGVAGTSVRQSSGTTATQLHEFTLPSGQSEFIIVRGNDVSFVSSTDANLAVSVQPADAGQSSTTYLVAGVVILGLLYYLSSQTEHSWMNALRGRVMPVEVTKPVAVVVGDGGQGPTMKAYGDNRVDTTG